MEKEIVNVTKKIRIYPLNNKPFDCLNLARRSYNLAIDHFKNTPYKEQLNVTELRRKIKAQVKLEFSERYYEAEVAGESVRQAFLTKSSVLKKRQGGLKCDYSFKSIKDSSQSYVKQRLFKSIIKMFYITEKINNDSYGRTTTINFINGRWFVNTITKIETKARLENQELKVASIDPGVRTFATTFYNGEVVKYGDNFYSEFIFPLALRLDKLIGKLVKHKNEFSLGKSQFFYDEVRRYNKKINKIKNRMSDLVSDLHKRTATDIVNKSDIILLPTFETKDMSNKIKRKIRSKTVRAMLGLGHYKFKLFIKWLAKKNGKLVIDVNEAYTSKTKSWNGEINSKLGGSKSIKDDFISVDRDVNGARGILLRALSRKLNPCSVIT